MTLNQEETDSLIMLLMPVETIRYQTNNNMVLQGSKINSKDLREAIKGGLVINSNNKATTHLTELQLTHNEDELYLQLLSHSESTFSKNYKSLMHLWKTMMTNSPIMLTNVNTFSEKCIVALRQLRYKTAIKTNFN